LTYKNAVIAIGWCTLFIIGAVSCVSSSGDKRGKIRGDFVGQALPVGEAPVLFAPGIVSTGLNERDFAITPDGDEIYFSIMFGERWAIARMVREAGVWRGPEIAPFSGEYKDIEPFVSYDGKRLYFSSNRPLAAGEESKDFDIWYMDRTGGGWGEPVNIGAPVNGGGDEFYPSLGEDGTLYFTADYEDGAGRDDIYRARWASGVYGKPELLGPGVNSETYEFNAFVAPDQSYIIFTSFGRDDDMGRGDLYISFADSSGEFSPAVNLGAEVNSPLMDYCPCVSRDGSLFFFTSRRIGTEALAGKISYADVARLSAGPGNGNADIYWMPADFISRLKFQKKQEKGFTE